MNIFGDKEFADFFEKQALSLLYFARSRIYDRDDAEDLCAEAWLRFYEGYRDESKIRVGPDKLLFGILRNLLSDYYKQKKQIKTALLLLEDLPDSTPSLETQHLQREFVDQVIACLFALSDKLKLAWLLKFDASRCEWIAVLAGKSGDEIRALYRTSPTREIFIDEMQAAKLMRISIWSYRRKYEKAQQIMGDLMRKNNWGDFIDRN
ncbi:MAG: sigma-70 family RNA polymerase sigma factor [Spirochaetes bacterium]|nr:sigma-70 family RNA polymerase sigma factor [Spirochaetota bacterium]